MASKAEAQPQVSLAKFSLYFLKLGCIGFGGPIALVGYMQKDLVDERKWISQQDYLNGLALSGRRTLRDDREDRFFRLAAAAVFMLLHSIGHRRFRRLGFAVPVLSEIKFICVWQWPGHRSISAWRSSPGTSLADGDAVSRRRGRRHDNPRPGGDHGCLHRLSCLRNDRSMCRRSGRVSARVPFRSRSRAILQTILPEHTNPGLLPGRYRRSNRTYCRN